MRTSTVRIMALLKLFYAALISLCCTGALAEPGLEQRVGFIECGRVQIRARAECYPDTSYCTTETLSFTRGGGRVIVPLHPHRSTQELPGGKARALAYGAASWACLRGRTGGRYLVVAMTHAKGGGCSECEYTRLYDLNGRLIAADLDFDASGHPRVDRSGPAMMRQVLGGPGPYPFTSVYRKPGAPPGF